MIKDCGDISNRKEIRRNFKSVDSLYCRLSPVNPDLPLNKLTQEISAQYGAVGKAEVTTGAEGPELHLSFQKTQALIDFITAVYKGGSPVNAFLTSPNFKCDYPSFVIKVINANRAQPAKQFPGSGLFQPPAPNGQFRQKDYGKQRTQNNQNYGAQYVPQRVQKPSSTNSIAGAKIASVADLNANLAEFTKLDAQSKRSVVYALAEKKIRENVEFAKKMGPEMIQRVCLIISDREILTEGEVVKVLNDDAKFFELVELSLEVKF